MATTPKHTWQFAARFRRQAFGWRSDVPIQRLKEALAEIKAVAKADPMLAAEGAVKLLEKLPPALENVDSSSGAIGAAVNRAVETLVPVIAKAKTDTRQRRRWLDRLFEAIQDDGMCYLDQLPAYWGELCATPDMASQWADELLPTVKSLWDPSQTGHGFFSGTVACLTALLAAGRHDELLTLLENAPTFWHYRQWGVKALMAQAKPEQALTYAEAKRGKNDPESAIATTCEDILLNMGRADEAYQRFAIPANRAGTHLATFRAIARKYPSKPQESILRDLIARHPGEDGKWFAAAKDAGQYALATELANTSPTDPRTLTRAARDYAESQPAFALNCGLAALKWIALGHGWEITGSDVVEALSAVECAATYAGADEKVVRYELQRLASGIGPGAKLIRLIIGSPQPSGG